MKAKLLILGACVALAALLIAAAWPAMSGKVYLDSEGLFRTLPDYREAPLRLAEALKLSLEGPFPGAARRPLPNLTFIAESHLIGMSPGFARIDNLILHVVNILLLFLVCRQLLVEFRFDEQKAGAMAFAAAFLWGLNPFHADTVLYVVQRMTLLSATFYLLAVLAYLKGRQQAGPDRFLWMGLVMACFLLGIGSKENAVLLPVGLVLVEWLFPDDGPASERRTNRRLWALLALVVVVPGLTAILLGWNPIALIRGWFEPQGREFDASTRLLTQGRVLVHYLTLFFLPLPGRLTFIFKYRLSSSLLAPWTTLGAWALILGSIAFAVRVRRRRPLVALAILWFFANHLLESTIVPLEMAFVHRNYVPTMFLLLPLVVGLSTVIDFRADRKRLLVTTAVVLVLLAGWHQRAIVWGDATAFWSDSIRKAPGSLRGYINLGVIRDLEGDPDESLTIYRRGEAAGFEETPASWASLYCCMGIAEMNLGNLEEAKAAMARAEDLASMPDCLINLAKLHLLEQDASAAHAVLNRLETARPSHRKLHLLRAHALVLDGDLWAAAIEVQKELQRYPDSAEAQQMQDEIRQRLQ